MKKTYLIIGLILICFSHTTAQYKTMFPSDSITWVHTIEVPDGTFNESLIYYGEKRTINDKPYYELDGLYGGTYFIREDLENGKTWMRKVDVNEDTIEILIMDLNLNIGDSILYLYDQRFNVYTQYVEVIRIDTINYRKIIEFDSLHNNLARWLGLALPLRFVEGIGPNFGLTYFNEASQVLCKLYYQDSLIYALDTMNQTCPIITNVTDFSIEQNISIYPNPAQSYVHITFNNVTSLHSDLYLYDVFGKLLLHQLLSENKSLVNLSAFDSQIILYKIITDEGRFNGKLLKQ